MAAQQPGAPSTAPGQRIAEYEIASTPSATRQALGFKVIKSANAAADGVQLASFPNEILTHILSHLHPDSHASVALTSKRFYSLVTTPHTWRMAFQRYFPGQDAMVDGKGRGALETEDSEFIRSDLRYFNRLTANATWRSEYLLRTRLLRSIARGKPVSAGFGSSTRASLSGKRANAVLTYNTKLPATVTHLHAIFASSAKKPPRVIHGAADIGMGSASDPQIGKVEKWGLDDPFVFAQLDEVVPQILPYGVGEGPAAVPNVMDVSQSLGLVGGEGFPGGRVFYRPAGTFRGKYLGQEVNSIIEAHSDIPMIPELSEGICSVWIAKSPVVLSLTNSMVGILTGSTLGVVTAYALGRDSSGPRYADGEISARWVLSPGVPIIQIRVDESYSIKKKAAGRVWAVALNALGEVFYLTSPPTPLVSRSKTDNRTKCAWYAGRSTYWHLIEATRRQARPDEAGKNAVRGAYSPRSPSESMNLTRGQMVAEAREIEKFLRYKPSHFRKVCDDFSWDMRRKLEADFSSDDEHGHGERVVIISCGLEEGSEPAVQRLTRGAAKKIQLQGESVASKSVITEELPALSLFGGGELRSPSPQSCGPPLKQVGPASGLQSPVPTHDGVQDDAQEWYSTKICLKGCKDTQITASSIDMSLYGSLAAFEDPLMDAELGPAFAPATSEKLPASGVPGRRARMMGIGTNDGKIMLWNVREGHTSEGVQPLRVIQTESPEVSSLALSALYIVHGGSDGLVQAWDPLGSTLDPIRTLNSRSLGRVPRHLIATNPAQNSTNFCAVGSIFLDPDPTQLRGVVAFGTFVRYWAYSSSAQAAGRKRRMRHSDMQSRPSGRRQGGGMEDFIATEAEELRCEQEQQARERAHLRARFGVGLGDLTEEEALRYAEMVSQEAFMLDEHRRTSASDNGSAAGFDTTSTNGKMDMVPSEPSVSSVSPPAAGPSTEVNVGDPESDYELQIQKAIRLSLMEGAQDAGQSHWENSSSEHDVDFKEALGHVSSPDAYSSSQTPVPGAGSFVVGDPDEELEYVLKLSLAEAEGRNSGQVELGVADDEFPALHGDAKGKGKGKSVW